MDQAIDQVKDEIEEVGQSVNSSVTGTFKGLADRLFGDLSLGTLLAAAITLLICLAATTLILKAVKRSAKRSRMNEAARGFLYRLLKVFLIALSILVAASTLGINVTSLVTVVGVASLAISLALQSTLSNLVGGVVLLTARSFQVGDMIQNGGVMGTVTSIGLFYTDIRTLDNTLVHIPNNTVCSNTIQNLSAEPKRRVEIQVTASYDSNIAAVKQALMDAVEGAPGLLADESVMAAVDSYNPNDIGYILRFWVETSQYFDARFAVMERIKPVFDERGLEMSYPHMNVHLDR